MSKDRENLTIVPILNQSLKGKEVDGVITYPIYLRVILGQKNTHLPIYLSSRDKEVNTYASEEEFEAIKANWERYNSSDFVEPNYAGDIRFQLITKLATVVRNLEQYESVELKQKFKLKGLRRRLDFMYTHLVSFVDQEMNEKLYNYLVDEKNAKSGNSSFIASLFDFSLPFEQNFDRLAWGYQEAEITLPEELTKEIEFTFLLKAMEYESSLSFRDAYPAYDFLVLKNSIHFYDFLKYNSKTLFDAKQLLKLPLAHPFSRYVSLVPPSEDVVFYKNMYEKLLRRITYEYKKLLA